MRTGLFPLLHRAPRFQTSRRRYRFGGSCYTSHNKVPRPLVVFAADGNARLVVRRETFDDLTRLDL